MLRPGGVRFGADEARRLDMIRRLHAARRDVTGSVELLFHTPSVAARFERVGIVRPEEAIAAGLVGVARRACGTAVDVRHDHPVGAWLQTRVDPAICGEGDVQSRAWVRWLEICDSLEMVERFLSRPLDGPVREPMQPLRPDHLAVGLMEGWRGPVLHLGLTGPDGRLTRYKVVDPSFHNWQGLALALRDEQISDFPLCNKSFNLSYCGVDL
jgi:Ni,Fe-hydrogenase III large subunit